MENGLESECSQIYHPSTTLGTVCFWEMYMHAHIHELILLHPHMQVTLLGTHTMAIHLYALVRPAASLCYVLGTIGMERRWVGSVMERGYHSIELTWYVEKWYVSNLMACKAAISLESVVLFALQS